VFEGSSQNFLSYYPRVIEDSGLF